MTGAATLALLAAAVVIASFVQGTIGVGFALILAPILGLLAPALLPGALLLVMLPLNAWVAWRERSALDWPGAGRITVGRVFGGVAGLRAGRFAGRRLAGFRRRGDDPHRAGHARLPAFDAGAP